MTRASRYNEVREMTSILNRLDDFGWLGETGLGRSRAVTAEMAQRALPDTAFQRGRILSRRVQREVERRFERHRESPQGRDVAEWTILYLRVHEGQSLQDIAQTLNMPLRSVGRYYQRAKQVLLDHLHEGEDIATELHLHCPICGAVLTSSMLAPPAVVACPRCRASVELTSVSGSGKFGLTVSPSTRLA
jgi:hypothetical protein